MSIAVPAFLRQRPVRAFRSAIAAAVSQVGCTPPTTRCGSTVAVIPTRRLATTRTSPTGVSPVLRQV